jgi:alpha-galactosidase
LDKFVKEHPEGIDINDTKHWVQTHGLTNELVKFDLYKRYGVLAAAGDRHLAEFCPGKWYLESPEKVAEYGFALTSVKWRKESLGDRYEKTKQLLEGKPFQLFDSGEESVRQIKALLGLGNFVTNVNVPNYGQQDGLPLGAIVETNAYFSGDCVTPLYAGKLPTGPLSMVQRICACQELTARAVMEEDYELAFQAFINDPNVALSKEDARKLFDEMLYNTRKYLPAYEKYVANRN